MDTAGADMIDKDQAAAAKPMATVAHALILATASGRTGLARAWGGM
jgi:nicotinic acid phosphoribosyltransferase